MRIGLNPLVDQPEQRESDMRKTLALLTILVASAPAQADDLSLYIGSVTSHPFSSGYDYEREDKGSIHFKDGEWKHPIIKERRDFNESNKLLAIEYKSVFAGYFKNSFNDDSFALGYRFSHQFSKNWEGSVLVGATYGYRDCSSSWDQFESKKICAAVSPMLTYTKYSIKPTLLIVGEAVSLTGRVDF